MLLSDRNTQLAKIVTAIVITLLFLNMHHSACRTAVSAFGDSGERNDINLQLKTINFFEKSQSQNIAKSPVTRNRSQGAEIKIHVRSDFHVLMLNITFVT